MVNKPSKTDYSICVCVCAMIWFFIYAALILTYGKRVLRLMTTWYHYNWNESWECCNFLKMEALRQIWVAFPIL